MWPRKRPTATANTPSSRTNSFVNHYRFPLHARSAPLSRAGVLFLSLPMFILEEELCPNQLTDEMWKVIFRLPADAAR